MGEREQPDISVMPLAVDAKSDQVSFQIEVLGTHLRTRDRMLLRVSGVSDATENPRERCLKNGAYGTTEGFDELYWGESGPNLRGEASTTATATVSSGVHRYICAYAALTGAEENPRQTLVALDLNNVALPARPLDRDDAGR